MRKRENGSALFGVATILATLLLVLPVGPAQAESESGATGGPLEIPELGAIIIATGDGPRVDDVAPTDWRLEKYRDVDLQAGDMIVAVNGTRTESLSALREVLDGAAAGDKITLALQRFGKLTVAGYPKADEAEVVAAKAAFEAGMEAGPIVVGGPGGKVQTMKIIGTEGSEPWMDLAVLLEDVDGRITISQVLPIPPPAGADIKLAEGDVITSLQNSEVTTAAALIAAYDEIEVGATVAFEYRRGDEVSVVTYEKPKMSGKMMKIRK